MDKSKTDASSLNQPINKWSEQPVIIDVEFHIDYCKGGQYCVFRAKDIIEGPFPSLKEAKLVLESLLGITTSPVKSPSVTSSVTMDEA